MKGVVSLSIIALPFRIDSSVVGKRGQREGLGGTGSQGFSQPQIILLSASALSNMEMNMFDCMCVCLQRS